MLAKDTIVEAYQQELRKLTAITVEESLKFWIRFYLENEISEVDSSVWESDMLLFEYGVYDWNDGKGENFTVSFTREFYIGELGKGEFHGVTLILYFNKHGLEDVEQSAVSTDGFKTVDDWSEKIRTTDGYIRTVDKSPEAFDCFLVQYD